MDSEELEKFQEWVEALTKVVSKQNHDIEYLTKYIKTLDIKLDTVNEGLVKLQAKVDSFDQAPPIQLVTNLREELEHSDVSKEELIREIKQLKDRHKLIQEEKARTKFDELKKKYSPIKPPSLRDLEKDDDLPF